MRRAGRVDGCGQLVLEERTLVSPGSSEMLSSVYEFLSTTVPDRDTRVLQFCPERVLEL